ncbi:MAG: Na+/H+ antiporter [Thermoleophilia bacterium]|nr:Na+/H+ antiporter [Thermoleophilia bacterium]
MRDDAAGMNLLELAHPELALLAVVAILAIVATAAQKSKLPYPIYLLLVGVGIGFIPGVPEIEIEPELIFLVFLPPLVYAAGYFTSLRELRRNLRAVSLLAIGLVAATMLTVAVVAHALVPGMPWAVAFVLGAIVSPTDTVAAAAVLERLKVPRRIKHITEGESLLNDGTGLVLFSVAVGVVVSGDFSAGDAAFKFVVNIIGGLAVGVGVGFVYAALRRFNQHGPTDVLLSVLAGYAAYMPAELLHVSGVLATAACSIWLGWRTPKIVRDPETRIQINAVWVNVNYAINTILFLLVGLQLPRILDQLGAGNGRFWLDAVLIGLVVIVTRLVWVFPATWIPRRLSARIREDEETPSWRNVFLVGWIGMRGSVTLAAALAIPLTVNSGADFPMRDLVIFFAFGTILMTLVVQGLTLPKVIAVLKPAHDNDFFERAEAYARLKAAQAAITAIEAVNGEEWAREDTIERMRGMYEYRIRRQGARLDDDDDTTEYEERTRDYKRLVAIAHQAEREVLYTLRDSSTISDEVVDVINRDLDYEDVRML